MTISNKIYIIEKQKDMRYDTAHAQQIKAQNKQRNRWRNSYQMCIANFSLIYICADHMPIFMQNIYWDLFSCTFRTSTI